MSTNISIAIDEILKSCKMLAQVILEIDKVETMREEVLEKLTEHTNHCTDSICQIKDAFDTMQEENVKLRQTLDELEAEMYLMSKTNRLNK
jgi:hypothetical protein